MIWPQDRCCSWIKNKNKKMRTLLLVTIPLLGLAWLLGHYVNNPVPPQLEESWMLNLFIGLVSLITDLVSIHLRFLVIIWTDSLNGCLLITFINRNVQVRFRVLVDPWKFCFVGLLADAFLCVYWFKKILNNFLIMVIITIIIIYGLDDQFCLDAVYTIYCYKNASRVCPRGGSQGGSRGWNPP